MTRKEIIGDCTLYLGDCREIIPEIESIDSMVTDPPYGMAFVSNHRADKHLKIQNDDNPDILKWACGLYAKHSKYIFCRWENLVDVPPP